MKQSAFLGHYYLPYRAQSCYSKIFYMMRFLIISIEM